MQHDSSSRSASPALRRGRALCSVRSCAIQLTAAIEAIAPSADSAGIVVGARVPVALTSRSDNVRMRIGSAAVAKLLAHRRRAASPPAGPLA